MILFEGDKINITLQNDITQYFTKYQNKGAFNLKFFYKG